MEDIISTGQKLLSKWTIQPARKSAEFKCCKTTRYGDIWVPKDVSDDLLKTINDKVGVVSFQWKFCIVNMSGVLKTSEGKEGDGFHRDQNSLYIPLTT